MRRLTLLALVAGCAAPVAPSASISAPVQVAPSVLASPRVFHARVDRSRPQGRTLNWHALALCESSDNPNAVSTTGRFRGLYQFDLGTWRGVGGSGDPARASRAEQTFRAQLLYMARGVQPWPECGWRLR